MSDLTRAKELYREYMTLLRPWEQRMFRQFLQGTSIPFRREVELIALFRIFALNHWEDCVRAAAAKAAAR